MARPTYVGGTTGGGTGASYNVSLNGTLTGGSGSSPQQGDLILVCAGHGGTASSAPTCSGNTSGAYQPVHAALYSNDTWDTNMRTFYQFAGATPDTTLTIGRTNNTTYGGATAVHVWRGVDTTTPLDVTPSTNSANNQSASRPNPPSHTPTTADAIVIACGTGMQTTAGSAFTIPSGMANGQSAFFDGSTSDCGTFMSSLDWTSGAYDPAAVTGGTTSTNGSHASATFSLRPVQPTALTQATTFTNSQSFYAATVATGAVGLTPALYSNTNTFYAATVSQQDPVTSLTQATRFDNSQSFYGPTVAVGAVALTPTLYSNANTFYAATLAPGAVALTPSRYDNTNTFYGPTVSQTAGSQSLTQATRFDSSQSFYGPTVARGAVDLTPSLYTNEQAFFASTLGVGAVALTPSLFANSSAFYEATVAREGDEVPVAGVVLLVRRRRR